MDFNSEYEAISKEIEDIRLTLHSEPELSFSEYKTTELIKSFCMDCGLKIIDLESQTGVVAYLDAGKPNTVALRADIDALSVAASEANGFKRASHNCGHDFHTASLLAGAKILSSNIESLQSNVVFIFQPAEETTQGANMLIKNGLFEKLPHTPRMVFGIHNRPEIPIGKVAVHRGALMAANTNFTVTVIGKACHGGQPHQGIDPIVCAASFVSSVQTVISRNTDPFDACVCTVCSIHGGSEDNQAPEYVKMTGSIRALSNESVARCTDRVSELAKNIAAAYRCDCKTEILPQVPAVYNNEHMYNIAYGIAREAFGEENIVDVSPVLGSEDFAVYGEYVPSFFYWVGSGSPNKPVTPWHSADFCIYNEYIPYAARLYCEAALYNTEPLVII